ncbi:Flagellar synthesis regulator FleN [Minicystis rosea]|nr:Flagellar synthesis regulator FleN [Minicystis rosea]
MSDLYDSTPPPPFSGFPPLPPFEGGASARGRRIIVVGGGRGGVGKTLLAVNLGVYFAQLGREVVVCDADPFGSNLHAVLGLDSPPLVSSAAMEEGTVDLVSSTVPGLRILPTAYDPMTATPVRTSRSAPFLKQIFDLEVDYAIVNLGASSGSAALDIFLQADVGITVTAPEPLAIETTYRFCRSLYLRTLRRALMKERFKLRLVEKVIAALPPLAAPPQIVAEIKRYDDGVAAIAAQEMGRITPRLVVGQTRLKSDLELGPSMAMVSERFLGMPLDYLGHIEHDDAVWLTVRRRQPLLIDSPTSKSARNIERVARRILALLAAAAGRPSDVLAAQAAAQARVKGPSTLYEVLGVPRTATDDEIRRAYKRQREIFRDGGLPVVSVVSQAALRQEQARIEEAYDTLLDPVRKRGYDLSTFPDDARVAVAPQRSTSASAAELLMLQAELAREINAETQFSGALLRKVRESQGIELSDISQRTKISVPHLAAIESEAPGDLPAAVYVQGFVQTVAKFLKLDPAQVSKTYMRRLREGASAPKR